jgi:thioredoxin reductase (NADPH)
MLFGEKPTYNSYINQEKLMRSKSLIIGSIALIVISIGTIGGWYCWQRFFASQRVVPHDFDLAYIKTRIIDQQESLIPIAVIGSGPAGLSAALYAARSNIYTVVFQGRLPGGQLTGTSFIENWPGILKILGTEVMKKSLEQATYWGAVPAADSIVKVDFSSWPYTLWTDNGIKVRALTVILAMGATPKRKGIPGEDEYWGRGVSTCAICDAPFFKEADIVIVGGGDSAAEEALQLAAYAKSITMIVRSNSLRASSAMQARLKSHPHIKILYDTDLTRIRGDDRFVTSIEVVRQGASTVMPIDGVFLAIGHEPNTGSVRDAVACDEHGYIQLKDHTQTSVPGVFAAGDVTDFRYRQAGVAAGDGIKAALDALAFLREHDITSELLQTEKTSFFNPEKEGARRELPVITTKTELLALLKAHKVVILDFFTPTCYSCTQLLPALEGAAAELGELAYFAKVDASESLELAEYLVVPKVPTIVVFRDGVIAARSKEVMTKRELLTLFEGIINS